MFVWRRRRLPRGWIEWTPAYVLVFLALFLLIRCAVFVTTDQEYAPIRMLDLAIEPDPLVLGKAGRLYNGLCLDQDEPLTVQVYLGLQSTRLNPLITAERIDLVGHNVTGQRVPLTLPGRGCYHETLTAIADPSRLQPGEWQVILTVVVTGPRGEMQFITDTSPPFRIIASNDP